MAWYNSTGKENHKSLFDNVEYDRCIFCGGSRTEIARTDFTIMFSEFEYNTGSICKTCYSANAKQVKAIQKRRQSNSIWVYQKDQRRKSVLLLVLPLQQQEPGTKLKP